MSRTRAPDLAFAPPPRPVAVPSASLREQAEAVAWGLRGGDLAGLTRDERDRLLVRARAVVAGLEALL